MTRTRTVKRASSKKRSAGAKKAAARRKTVRRAAVGAAAVGAVAAAARAPQSRSVISRVVEQVRDTASGIGSSVSNLMPGHREEEMGGMGGGETDSDMNDEF